MLKTFIRTGPIFLIISIFSSLSWAQGMPRSLATSQGISLPAKTSMLSFSSGYTGNNPAGVIYHENVLLSLLADQNGSNGYGAEIGAGGASWGLSAGYYKRSCTNCEGTGRGAAGIAFGGMAIGLQFEENISSLGLLFNPQGTHRLGLVGQLNDPTGSDNNITALGVGYAYVNGAFEFSLDASTRTFENTANKDDRIFLSPGVLLHSELVSLSLNYERLINDTNEQNTNEENGDLWFGLGIGKNTWHLAAYFDYYNELALSFSLSF